MCEILFRGKRIDNGEWVEGYLHEIEVEWDRYEYGMLPTKYQYVITPINFLTREPIEIDSKTIGQYTGLKDKNGVKIFEGDICSDNKTILQVMWSENHQWCCKIIKGGILVQGLVFPLWQLDKCPANGNRELEIIGNIYENPELLGVE